MERKIVKELTNKVEEEENPLFKEKEEFPSLPDTEKIPYTSILRIYSRLQSNKPGLFY